MWTLLNQIWSNKTFVEITIKKSLLGVNEKFLKIDWSIKLLIRNIVSMVKPIWED